MGAGLKINVAITLPAADLSWHSMRSSGPGGQNVNKVASKVELRFDLPGTVALDDAVKARLRALARGRLDAQGQVVVTSQLTRDRERNLADARAKLASLVARALVVPKPRKRTRPTAAAKERRLREKRRNARRKAERRADD